MRDSEDPPPPRFMTPREVAEYLNVTTRTVNRWIASGKLRSKSFGPRMRRVAEVELKEFIYRLPCPREVDDELV